MPRMSDAEKQKSHGRILDAAARILRAEGVDATSVADVMKAAGMTHGGFYRHFGSKQDLVAAAVDHAADGVLQPVEQKSLKAPGEASATYVSDYLSDEHRRHREKGCPLAAIAGEALREDGPVREAAERAARRTVRLLSEKPESADPDAPVDDLAYATLSVLVGTIVLARLFREEDEAARVLREGEKTIRILRANHAKRHEARAG